MKTERARELYSDYAEGTLSPAMRLALEQHFESDAAARADYDQFARMYALLDSADAVEVDVPLGFRARVLEMAAQEQAKRGAVSQPRSLLDWFRPAPRRWATGGLAAFAVVALAFVLPRIITPGTVGTSALGGGITTTRRNAPASVVTGVSTQPTASGGTQYLFHVHLPRAVPKATVTAFVAMDAASLLNPATRAQATPALRQPQPLANDEEMQIPITLQQAALPGSTLNMYVEWQTADSKTSGAEIVFTPIAGADRAATTAPGGLLDALQQISSAYGVTVIADAAVIPSQASQADTSGANALAALKAVTGPVAYDVQKLPDGSFHVFPRR